MNKKTIFLSILVLAGLAVFVYAYFPGTFGLNDNKDSGANPTESPERSDSTEAGTAIFFGDNFSFVHSAKITLSQEEVEGGELIMASGDVSGVFQLFIIPFDEKGPLTPERIKKDVPDMIIKNEKSLDVSGVKALTFESKDESGTETFEVWFVSGGKLYQMAGYDESKKTIQEILKSWEWAANEVSG